MKSKEVILPDLRWHRSAVEHEESRQLLIDACCHFLDEVCTLAEVAQIRFSSTNDKKKALSSGIVHRKNQNVHDAVFNMAFQYDCLSKSNEETVMHLAHAVDQYYEIKALFLNVEFEQDEIPDGPGIAVVNAKLEAAHKHNMARSIPSCNDHIQGDFCILKNLHELINDISYHSEVCIVNIAQLGFDKNSSWSPSNLAESILNPIKAFLYGSYNKGSLIYVPVRGIWLRNNTELAGGLYIYNLTGNKIKMRANTLNYLVPIVSMIGGHQDISLHTDENLFGRIKRIANTARPSWFSPDHPCIKHKLSDNDDISETKKCLTQTGLILPIDFATNQWFYNDGLKCLLLPNEERRFSSIYTLLLIAMQEQNVNVDEMKNVVCKEEFNYPKISEDGLNHLYNFFTNIVKHEDGNAETFSTCELSEGGLTIVLKDGFMNKVLVTMLKILQQPITGGRHKTSEPLAKFIKECGWRLFVNKPSDQICVFNLDGKNGDINIWVEDGNSFIRFSKG